MNAILRIALLLLLVASPLVSAQQPLEEDAEEHFVKKPGPEFALGVGYAHFSIGGPGSLLHSTDALHFDPAVSFPPLRKLPQLRLGAAVGVSVVGPSQWTAVRGDTEITGSSCSPLVLAEPELRVSWRQTFGTADGFFVEPGVAVGGVFGKLRLEKTDVDEAFEHHASSFSGRVFLNLGGRVGGWTAGVQTSYLHSGQLDFAE